MKFFKSACFPYKSKKQYTNKHYAIIGVGCNIGDCRRRFQKLFYFLSKDLKINILQASSILKNPPFGYLNQDDFYNAIFLIKTDLSPALLLRYLLKIEKKYRRKRYFPNSPRTLDLDIIFYDKITLIKPFLQIPHTKWFERESVILPLRQLQLNKDFILKSYRKKIKGAYEAFIF